MNERQIAWRGLQIDSIGPFFVNRITGWLGLPGASFVTQPASGHGAAATPGVQGPRIVQAEGWIFVDGDRDARIEQMSQHMVPRASSDPTTEPLTITMGSRTATAQAQLINFAPLTEAGTWGSAGIPWRAQWKCPDPRVFLPTVTVSAPLVAFEPGAALPQTLPFTMPAKPIGGRVMVNNLGSDPEGSPVIVALVGGQSGDVGVVNLTTGARLVYAVQLGVADVLLIDTERGGAFLNGEYRPPLAGSSVTADLRAAPGINTYDALGIPGAGAPSINVSVRPALW